MKVSVPQSRYTTGYVTDGGAHARSSVNAIAAD
jgi:hypothetical protein